MHRKVAFSPFTFLIGFALSLLLVAGLALRESSAKYFEIRVQTPDQKGISYASWWPGQYSHPDADLALTNLAATGTDWISLIVTQYQETISSTVISSTAATPTDADLVHVITLAHSLGLKVMLKPHVDLGDDPGHWRGQIGQSFAQTQWSVWFASYQNFINHYAQLAQTYNVEQFCVGTELSATQDQAVRWRTVITDVRSHYTGTLTYAANWDNAVLTWWDAVDLIGVDAYYPLTHKCDPTIAELEAGWEPYVTALATLSSTWGKPIIFAEMGYRSQDCNNQHPWDWQVNGTVDLQEQADAYQAAFESVYDQSWFTGVFWWVWDTDPFAGGPCDDGYTPHNKPAEDVLRSWYGAPPRVRLPDPQPDYGRTLEIYTDDLGPGWEDWSWDARVDLFSISPVSSGTHAISVTAQAWGALSLHHESFDSSPYHWLEFYVRKSSSEQQLRAFVNDERGVELRYRSVDDCRYTEGKAIEPGVWTKVRIPLSHLNALGRVLQRVSIKNYSDQPSSFWIDEIRLVGASWRVYLPVVVRNSH